MVDAAAPTRPLLAVNALLAQIDDPFHKESYYLEKWGYQVDEIGNVPYTK